MGDLCAPPPSPFPSQNRVGQRSYLVEAFLYRLGRMFQHLGYTPLFLLDRGFDRATRMRKLKDWGMAFLIRVQRNQEVETEAGERFPKVRSRVTLGEHYPVVARPERKGVRLFGPSGQGIKVTPLLAQGKREP